jgi:DNA-binding transcriptional regulator YhcF (GntR family)
MKINKNQKLENEKTVVQAIKAWYLQHNYGPSFRDLSEMTKISLGGVHSICKDLRDVGIIQYEDNVARTVKIKDRA